MTEAYKIGDRAGVIITDENGQDLIGVVVDPVAFTQSQQSAEAATLSGAYLPGVEYMTQEAYEAFLSQQEEA